MLHLKTVNMMSRVVCFHNIYFMSFVKIIIAEYIVDVVNNTISTSLILDEQRWQYIIKLMLSSQTCTHTLTFFLTSIKPHLERNHSSKHAVLRANPAKDGPPNLLWQWQNATHFLLLMNVKQVVPSS
jgi:hypothetical protein